MSWEELLEPGNRELLAASVPLMTMAYGLHQNDWGAEMQTTHDLEQYVDEASSYRPLQYLKSRKYGEELKKRETY